MELYLKFNVSFYVAVGDFFLWERQFNIPPKKLIILFFIGQLSYDSVQLSSRWHSILYSFNQLLIYIYKREKNRLAKNISSYFFFWRVELFQFTMKLYLTFNVIFFAQVDDSYIYRGKGMVFENFVSLFDPIVKLIYESLQWGYI